MALSLRNYWLNPVEREGSVDMSAMFCETCNLKAFPISGLAKFTAMTILVVAGFSPILATAQEPGQKTFHSASAATQALVAAVQANDETALLNILGPSAKEVLSSGDTVEDKDRRQQFVQKYRQMHRMVIEPNGLTTLYIGAENWPTPIPLAHKNGEWYFDTAAGKREILARRVGQNEMTVIQVCHELVDAEKEYQGQEHPGEQGKQYAERIYSNPGQENGLYWQASSGQPESPIGPLVAQASLAGYSGRPGVRSEPFYGYYFRVLTAQGPNAAGGARSYIVDGKMTRGFAFIAFPAEYRSSGVMTFIVSQAGKVYQKDLGPNTGETAKNTKSFDPDSSWHAAE